VEPLLVFPDPPPPELVRHLDLDGRAWKPVGDERAARSQAPDDGWGGAIVVVGDQPEAAWALCRAIRKGDVVVAPLLLLIGGNRLDELELRDDLYDDFCLDPFHPRELDARLRHLLATGGTPGAGAGGDLIEHGGLVLNLATYQAAIEGRPIDLTYMEYELLKFLAQHPGQVFTRETLLSRVWGYEYYGGARTVDVHVRRLRAKLGEEHANLIATVRSVGYRFGQSRWAGTA